MARSLLRRMAVLVTMASCSALFVVCAGATSGASTATYQADRVQFQAYFPSRVTTTALTKADLGSSFSGVPLFSATLFSAGVEPKEIFPSSSQIPKPNAFAMIVLTFSSTSYPKKYFQAAPSAFPSAKKVTVDGRSAYIAVGNAAKMNSGNPVPDEKATEGDLTVLDGKSIIVAAVETKTAATTTAFFSLLKILF